MATQPTTMATRRRGGQGEIEREGEGGRESYNGLLPGLKAWKEALDIDMICSCSQWEPPVGVIWRGPIHITEKRVHVHVHIHMCNCTMSYILFVYMHVHVHVHACI